MTRSVSAVVPFVKASGCGNDFLIIDGRHVPQDLAAFTRRICDRHNGVGADGVEWLFPAQDADICARLVNADGSEAEISGNGTRCVAAYLCSQQPREEVTIRTGAGARRCTLISLNDTQYEFETAMGVPEVAGEIEVELRGRAVRGIFLSMGNPHFVIFAPEFPPDWQSIGAEIARSPAFKQGVNVEFVNALDQSQLQVRFYERGVGETQSSGTGSCASAVAAISAKHAISPVRVHATGGAQTVRWEDQVYLRGPARLICRGEFLG